MKSEDKDYLDKKGFEDLSNKNHEQDLLEEELDEMREALHESQQEVLRLRAELDNQRKRLKGEIEKVRETAAFEFITGLLPVKDSMEKGLDISYMEDGNIKAEELFEGMSSTLKVLNDAFKRAGIEEVDPLGEAFNPEIHEAMTVKNVLNEPVNKVLCVYQKGYLLNGRLIRPARVEVSVN